MNNRKGSVLQHGAQRGSKESNTRTVNNKIRQLKNKYQQIKSRNIKALNKVASVSCISSIKIRTSLTIVQLAEMCEKRKSKPAQVTQSHYDMTCIYQNKTFIKSPNSSTQAYRGDLVVQANSINWVSNKNNINKNTLNKMNDRANDRVIFVGNQMPTAHDPYDANIILEQEKAYEQVTEKN
jgi:hypothetical protein